MDEREPVRLPTPPSGNTVEPPAPQPPQPVVALYADPTGDFEMTFTASTACEQLPAQFRTRAYRASIVATNGRSFEGRVSSGSFYKNYDSFFITTSSNFTKLWISSVYAMTRWDEDQPVFERVGDGGYVSVMGMAENISLDAKITTASALWNGSFDFCSRATDSSLTDYPPACNSVISCKSDSHRVNFTRR